MQTQPSKPTTMRPDWIHVGVVIPYFQRQPGILRRAIESILAQRLPDGVGVQIVVVDDGSPSPVWPEIEGFVFESPFAIRIVPQANAGVAAARNAGLDAMAAIHRYVAFLDSDDIWPTDHLASALAALEDGLDLYFCDNAREGFHTSYLADRVGTLLPTLEPGGICRIPRDTFAIATLQANAAQLSTIVYRRRVHPHLRFEPTLRHAGEDLLFLMELSQRCASIGFSVTDHVTCSDGINMYYSNFGWDSPLRIAILLDRVAALSAVPRRVALSPQNRRELDRQIATLRRDIVYQVMRKTLKDRRIPSEAPRLAENGALTALVYAGRAAELAVLKAMGRYQPQ